MSASRDSNFELNTFVGIWKAILKSVMQGVSFWEGCKLLLAAARQFSDFQCSTLVCCADVFIITVSVILTMRFRQIAERIDLLIQEKVKNGYYNKCFLEMCINTRANMWDQSRRV